MIKTSLQHFQYKNHTENNYSHTVFNNNELVFNVSYDNVFNRDDVNNNNLEPQKNNIEFGEYVKAVGQVFSSYIIAERGNEMYIIDQHAAYERLNYERIYKTLMSGGI